MANWTRGGRTLRDARSVLIGTRAQIEGAATLLRSRRALTPIGACPIDGQTDMVGDLPAIGPIEALASALALVKAEHVIWAAPPNARALARQVLDNCVRAGCDVSVAEAAGLRPLEIDDLLGAPRIDADPRHIARAFAGQRVLITGGGGSIGTELMRRVAALAPARLVALDSSELSLHNVAHDPALADIMGREGAVVYADVRDLESLRRIMARERPDIVIHAAALKHVPLVEDHASQGFLTNVLGTQNVAACCAAFNARLVFVSTDKAVQPTSVMGATKRLAGLYCRARDEAGDLRSIVVRLGNVLGSTGSAAPLFAQQVARGGPVTVTHAEAQRYFVTVAQAADFLLQAAAIGFALGAPRGAAYVLEMKDEIPIVDLARDMIRLNGQIPDRDVSVSFVGLRAGEKVREALVADDEALVPTAIPAIHAVSAALPARAVIDRWIAEIAALAHAGDDDAVRAALHRAVGARAAPAREAI